MAFKLLNALVQSRDRGEHLIVLVLEFLSLVFSGAILTLHHVDRLLELIVTHFFIVKVLLDAGACSDCLHGQLHGTGFVFL